MTASYLLGPARTPIGKLLGELATLPAPQLAARSISASVERSGLPLGQINEVILGHVLSAGVGQAPARQAALAARLPTATPASTVNMVCGSGLKAIMLADVAIRARGARAIVAGGMENMSLAPHLLIGSRRGWKFGATTVLDSMAHDGLLCAHENQNMGVLAELTATTHQISRADQDGFAHESHRRATTAIREGKLNAEIIPVPLASPNGEKLVTRDEGPRDETASLSQLRPAFVEGGTITAGNASQISDGAATVLVANEDAMRESTSPIKAKVVAAAAHGVAPKDLFIAPLGAIEKALAHAGLIERDIDLYEINEAFAAQCLACMRSLRLDSEKVNVHGGAIALGHPLGASGARVMVTLLHAMADRGATLGLAALCLGGGNAVAMIVERL